MLPRLRQHLVVGDIDLYAEPFIGMGSVYLDLRARGYTGGALVADAIPELRLYWKAIHDKADARALVIAARKLPNFDRDVELYKRILSESPEGPADRVARFLWLTQYGFGAKPVTWCERTKRWMRGSTGRSVYDVSWNSRVRRIAKLGVWLARFKDRFRVFNCGVKLIRRLPSVVTAYCDPPYQSTTTYKTGQIGNFLAAILGSEARIVLSEYVDLTGRLPPGWSVETVPLAKNLNGNRGSAVQSERIYRSF